MKILRPLCCLGGALVCVVAAARAGDGPIAPGQLFMAARTSLVRAGWKPVDLHTGDDYEFIGVEKELRDSKVVEVESCAMDRAACIFNYVRRGKCLRVVTTGESVPTMRVERFDGTCPRP